MKRSSFIKSLGALVGAAFIPESKSTPFKFKGRGYKPAYGYPYEELMRITSSGNIGMGVLNPKQILKVKSELNS
jgi:hypothetical protein